MNILQQEALVSQRVTRPSRGELLGGNEPWKQGSCHACGCGRDGCLRMYCTVLYCMSLMKVAELTPKRLNFVNFLASVY